MSKTDRSGEKEFICLICNKPVDLEQDRYADEDGKIVHESCYLKRLISGRYDPPDPHHAQ